MKAFPIGNMFSFTPLTLGGTSRRRVRITDVYPGLVGPVLGADGTTPSTGRQGKTGETSVSQTHGKYYEPSSRAVLFGASDQGAGVAVQTSITTTGNLSLHNPVGSGKRLSIKKVSIAYFNGTLGAGAFYHAFNPVGTTLPSAGTTLTANCMDIGNLSGVAAVGVAKTGATVVAATCLYPFLGCNAELATSVTGIQLGSEDVDGAIVIEPGGVYQLVSVMGAGGTSPKVAMGIVWEEIPLVASQG